ncbi:hypothetical protein Nepgr_001271 [Nepenthes gracilis]|uniref:Uncharacterized protein n=1 Tax=Nepenthes gracilis TaxID=150966 RepID=A0AAD3RVZ5_NEPGR|nr:hypothetical protein Nepgr_001271 [Nepenthes gracilis]
MRPSASSSKRASPWGSASSIAWEGWPEGRLPEERSRALAGGVPAPSLAFPAGAVPTSNSRPARVHPKQPPWGSASDSLRRADRKVIHPETLGSCHENVPATPSNLERSPSEELAPTSGNVAVFARTAHEMGSTRIAK